MKVFEGTFQGTGLNIAIVVSRFNELISKGLLEGALDSLRRHGVKEEHISVAWVPGALEIPITALQFAKSGKFDAVICLGAVIRGATSHYDVVVNLSASGAQQAAMQTGVPVLNAILTVENIEQALERCGTKAGNKGFDVATGAIEMANLMKKLG